MSDELVEPLAESPLPEPSLSEAGHVPVEPHAALARKNNLWGWALFGAFLLLFAGSFAVALVYLALD